MVGRNTYDEYGIRGPNNIGRFQYTGQAFYYYKARIYAPTLGRFLQTDPIGYGDQINLYAYVANDPVNGRDATGKERCQGSAADCSNIAAGAARVRDMAAKTPAGSELQKTSVTIGAPGKGALVIANPEITDQGHFDARAAEGGAIVVGSTTLGAGPDLIGGVLAHEGTHKSDYDANGEIKTGKERLDTERHSYGVENEYRKAQGWSPRDVEHDAKRSFDKACPSSSDHPFCK